MTQQARSASKAIKHGVRMAKSRSASPQAVAEDRGDHLSLSETQSDIDANATTVRSLLPVAALEKQLLEKCEIIEALQSEIPTLKAKLRRREIQDSGDAARRAGHVKMLELSLMQSYKKNNREIAVSAMQSQRIESLHEALNHMIHRSRQWKRAAKAFYQQNRRNEYPVEARLVRQPRWFLLDAIIRLLTPFTNDD